MKTCYFQYTGFNNFSLKNWKYINKYKHYISNNTCELFLFSMTGKSKHFGPISIAWPAISPLFIFSKIYFAWIRTKICSFFCIKKEPVLIKWISIIIIQAKNVLFTLEISNVWQNKFEEKIIQYFAIWALIRFQYSSSHNFLEKEKECVAHERRIASFYINRTKRISIEKVNIAQSHFGYFLL